jgi:phosphatidylglycerophosphate synthase
MSQTENRRPLKSRSTGWARQAAMLCARAGMKPDMVSALSLAFAALGCGLLVWSGEVYGAARAAALVAAAACVQLRLLANMLDGMVAVEHGRGSPAGPIWNELPDRLADALFLVGAGYGAMLAGIWQAEPLGWIAALLAVMTAYVRELGRGLGLPADFSGPMAKPHRMAALTGLCLISAAEGLWGWRGETLAIGLGLTAIGTAVTVARRTLHLARALKARPG